jgi:hypothetical protein
MPGRCEILLDFLACDFWKFVNSQQSTQQQQQQQNNAAMQLIDSVTSTDEEGRSRQRVLTFAARR